MWHLRSRRKPTGGRLRPYRKKKKYEKGRDYIPATIGERKVKKIRVRGGNEKLVLIKDSYVNVATKEGIKRVKILNVIENPCNQQYARQNIITKGAIVETELGKVRITSRPGQHGIINGILIEN